MYETVSVDDALSRGRRMINIPVPFIMFIPPVLFLLAVIFYDFSGWTILISALAGFVLAWLFWSFMITRWRLWAFDNVRNVHELRARAIKEKLIWPDGKFFEKTEIRTSKDKEKWLSLQEKFSRADIFIDDLTVPNATDIYYSKSKTTGAVITILACIGGCVYLLIATDKYLIGIGGCILFVIYFFIELKKVKNKNVQVVLSNDGIQTENVAFNSWSDIKGEDVIAERTGKTVSHYFIYDYPNGTVKVDIADYDTNKRRLEKLLRVYRGRSENKSTRS